MIIDSMIMQMLLARILSGLEDEARLRHHKFVFEGDGFVDTFAIPMFSCAGSNHPFLQHLPELQEVLLPNIDISRTFLSSSMLSCHLRQSERCTPD